MLSTCSGIRPTIVYEKSTQKHQQPKAQKKLIQVKTQVKKRTPSVSLPSSGSISVQVDPTQFLAVELCVQVEPSTVNSAIMRSAYARAAMALASHSAASVWSWGVPPCSRATLAQYARPAASCAAISAAGFCINSGFGQTRGNAECLNKRLGGGDPCAKTCNHSAVDIPCLNSFT